MSSGTTDWYNSFPEFAQKNPLGLTQIIAGTGVWEGYFNPSDFWTGEGKRAPGNLGFDPLNFSKASTRQSIHQAFVIWTPGALCRLSE